MNDFDPTELKIVPMRISRTWRGWEARPLVPDAEHVCDTQGCAGLTEGPVFARALTRDRLNRKVVSRLILEERTRQQIAASESLGG